MLRGSNILQLAINNLSSEDLKIVKNALANVDIYSMMVDRYHGGRKPAPLRIVTYPHTIRKQNMDDLRRAILCI